MGVYEKAPDDASSEVSNHDSILKDRLHKLENVDSSELEASIALSSVLKTMKAGPQCEIYISITNKSTKPIAIRMSGTRCRIPSICRDTEAFHRDIENGTVSTDPKYECVIAMFTIVKPSKILSPFWKWKDPGFQEIQPGHTLAYISMWNKSKPVGQADGSVSPKPITKGNFVSPNLKPYRRTLVSMREYPVKICPDFSLEDWKAGRVDLDTPNINGTGPSS